MPRHAGPQRNHLLAALPAEQRTRLLPELELVALPFGAAICDPGRPMRHAYFPTTAIVSLVCHMEDGTSPEIAAIGNEGVVGVALFMGGETMPHRAVVQSAGLAYRLDASLLKREFEGSEALRHLLLRYTQALLTQIAQTAVCSRHHSLGQRLCRWLLVDFDRLPGNELTMTQESIAGMLGVRREGVTEAAGKARRAGLIACNRGRISVLDRAGLEANACECYSVLRKEFERLLPETADM